MKKSTIILTSVAALAMLFAGIQTARVETLSNKETTAQTTTSSTTTEELTKVRAELALKKAEIKQLQASNVKLSGELQLQSQQNIENGIVSAEQTVAAQQ